VCHRRPRPFRQPAIICEGSDAEELVGELQLATPVERLENLHAGSPLARTQSKARWIETPQIETFWYGAYGGCPELQTYYIRIVMRCFEVRYLVYYQFT
jgi:hypothetical protein